METFFEDHAPDDFVELDINIPRNYKEKIIYDNDQAEKTLLLFAEELATRDSTLKVVKGLEF